MHAPPTVWASFREFAEAERKSRRKNRRFCGAGSLTTARSAGSYGDFYVAVKWGQKQQAGITFAVTFPECLEAWTKSRGHAGDTYSFLLLCHTVLAGAPPQELRR